jgi:hypothetical protein
VFKVEIYLADGISEGKIKTIGKGFIQPIDLKSSCGIIDVGLVHKGSPVGSLQGIY